MPAYDTATQKIPLVQGMAFPVINHRWPGFVVYVQDIAVAKILCYYFHYRADFLQNIRSDQVLNTLVKPGYGYEKQYPKQAQVLMSFFPPDLPTRALHQQNQWESPGQHARDKGILPETGSYNANNYRQNQQ